MSEAKNPTRRRVLELGIGCATAAAAAPLEGRPSPAAVAVPAPLGRLRQSVSRWCYKQIPLETLATAAAGMGLVGIDLVDDPADWPVIARHGLLCTMTRGAGTIPEGFNRREHHDRLERELRETIPRAAAAGLPNVITFSGNRRGLSDQEGLENCVTGLTRVKGLAAEHRVTICLELLNSKVDHRDYQCDHAGWALDLIRRVDSPRVKLLYDVYHAQIMDGDVIRTIRDNIGLIGHFHTGGVPGRHELDDSQELNWRTICRAIADLGFSGYVAHEFVPTRDPLTSLRQAVEICTV